jgi:hypothetical protein
MRSHLCFVFASLFATAAFAQDDFYARQLENRQFEERQFSQQLETRRIETQRLETQRVEQARVRKEQDRADQRDTDVRFAQQQRELAASRRGSTPFTVPGQMPPARERRTASPTCRSLRLTRLVLDGQSAGVRGPEGHSILLAAFTGEVDGKPARLVVTTPIDEWGYASDEVAVAIHRRAAGSRSWFHSRLRLAKNEYHGSPKKGSWALEVRDVIFADGGGCVSLGRLEMNVEWRQ